VADSLSWIKGEWFSVVQTVGIIGGLLFTGITCQQQAKAQKEQAKAQDTQNLIAFADRHRSLWSEVYQKPELQRIFRCSVDLVATPPTVAEEEYLNVVFAHYETGWQIAENSYPRYLEPLILDVAKFFSFPIPSAVWQKTERSRDQQFVEFVKKAMRQN